ncbi:hypothetical protein BJ912DRAFT_935675 [Pholiota molesta]|nr:hypothetical protein BJ912DRAFT_935675 [Pholiota molesta]
MKYTSGTFNYAWNIVIFGLQYSLKYEYIKETVPKFIFYEQEDRIRIEGGIEFSIWGGGEGATILCPNWVMPSTAGLKIVPFRPAMQYSCQPHVWFTTLLASECHNPGVIKSSKISYFMVKYRADIQPVARAINVGVKDSAGRFMGRVKDGKL